MALNAGQHLRMLLGEDTPSGGDDSDTMFKDAEIQHFLDITPDVERAAFEGWKAKAARLSTLVDTTEGNAQKKYSQSYQNALDMMKIYAKAGGSVDGVSTAGRTRVGRIVRPAVFDGN
jgi:hypothetical protein